MSGNVQAVAYLVVLGEQNPQILNEFLYSFRSLRRHHPDLPVMLYHAGLHDEQLAYLRGLPRLVDFPIGIDRSGKFGANRYGERYGWVFPELHVLAAKIDVLLLTPGDTLFLDTDTEVHAPLDDVLGSRDLWMYASEGPLAAHDRDWSSVVGGIPLDAYGWRLPIGDVRMLNSGAVYVPQESKPALYAAKELVWAFAGVPAAARGDNRLDEQLALSIALEQASGGRVREVAPRVEHYWLEKYESVDPRYPLVFQPVTRGDAVVMLPRPPLRGLRAATPAGGRAVAERRPG